MLVRLPSPSYAYELTRLPGSTTPVSLPNAFVVLVQPIPLSSVDVVEFAA